MPGKILILDLQKLFVTKFLDAMTDPKLNNPADTPWHLWVVGTVGLLWSAMGAMDYVMTQTRNENYMVAFTPDQLEFFYGFPVWVEASWAIAVWGGVIGSIFLLLRHRIAVWLFLASLVAMLITSFQNYVLSNGMEVIGDTFSIVFTLVIFLVALGLYLYSRSMLRQRIIS